MAAILSRPQWVNSQGLVMVASWWHHDMEPYSTLLALCEGNPPVTRGFPPQRARNTELKCFLWCAPERTVEKTVELLVIWGAMTVMLCHCSVTVKWTNAVCPYNPRFKSQNSDTHTVVIQLIISVSNTQSPRAVWPDPILSGCTH